MTDKKQALIARLEEVLTKAEIKYTKIAETELQYLEHNDTDHAKQVFVQLQKMTQSLIDLENKELAAADEALAAIDLEEIRAENDLLGLFQALLDHQSDFLAQKAEDTLEKLEALFAEEHKLAGV